MYFDINHFLQYRLRDTFKKLSRKFDKGYFVKSRSYILLHLFLFAEQDILQTVVVFREGVEPKTVKLRQ